MSTYTSTRQTDYYLYTYSYMYEVQLDPRIVYRLYSATAMSVTPAVTVHGNLGGGE